ncbi:MAG: GNAT family N-acetyltransferase [Bacteroidales bacterium]|nr:GNAT family N-acetyltransferase [Bacteroidales bacterium]
MFNNIAENYRIVKLLDDHIISFKNEMQEAFHNGFVPYKKTDPDYEDDNNPWQILPDEDFYQSLNAEGALAYEAMDADGNRVGGSIIIIDNNAHTGELAFLYVKDGAQSKGIGKFIWSSIEKLHPDIKIWETCTPYFERRNVHFYINCCGFHAIEYFCGHHPDPNTPEHLQDDSDGMFRFQKVMR